MGGVSLTRSKLHPPEIARGNLSGGYRADQVVLTTQAQKSSDISYKLRGEGIVDSFQGVTVWWSLSSSQENASRKSIRSRQSQRSSATKEFVLKFFKKDKEFVMREYLDHVVAEAMEFRHQQRDINLFASSGSNWRSYLFKHPSTFETLVIEPALKCALKADLDAFKRSENYFRGVGRAWKRGYLLHGPPGTGKSSMIAAIANYLKYDVYDLELTEVRSNDALKRLLCRTTNRSIVVIEDIDCSLDLAGKRDATSSNAPETCRKSHRGCGGGCGGGRGRGRGRGRHIGGRSEVTLSGLLNSTDGLWSSGTDERIVIFTTNHIEKLDPALIRPGRMDMHISMSYCSFASFKELACSYLCIDAHPCYDTIGKFFQEGVLITPAQVTDHMIGNQHDPSAAMQSLMAELQKLKDVPAQPAK